MFYLLFLLFLIVFVAKPYVLLVLLVIFGFGELSLLCSLKREEEKKRIIMLLARQEASFYSNRSAQSAGPGPLVMWSKVPERG